MARLVAAAAELRLGALDPDLVRRAFAELARAAFGAGAGVVRLQASRDGDGALHLVGAARRLEPDPPHWSAVSVRLPAAGSDLGGGLKVSSRLSRALAADAADEAGADEALIVDGAGRLVEGARSNVLVVGGDGAPATPPLAGGAVGGIARAVALERLPEIEERAIADDELRRAREILACNAVRGARPVLRLDGAAVGDGRPGPWAARLAEALAGD